MFTRVLAVLLLPAPTRYGFPPPGVISSFPVVFPCAIDGEFHASTTTTTHDSVTLIAQQDTQQSWLLSRCRKSAQRAPLHVVAFNISHEATPPLWQAPVPTSPTQLVVESSGHSLVRSSQPLVRSKFRDVGRPPDPGSTFLLNTSMVERFLLELLIYLGFEVLRSPLSIWDAVSLVCRLWLGISATLLWFFTYCANVTYFVLVCALLLAIRVMFVISTAVSMALGVVCYTTVAICGGMVGLLRCTVNLTRALGDSIAGLTLYRRTRLGRLRRRPRPRSNASIPTRRRRSCRSPTAPRTRRRPTRSARSC